MSDSGEAEGRLTASRLAFEANIRRLENERRTLEALRARSLTFLSVSMGVAGVVLSVGLSACECSLGSLMWPGVLVAVGLVGGVVCVGALNRPLVMHSEMSAQQIKAGYVDCDQPVQSAEEVYWGFALELEDSAYKAGKKVGHRWTVFWGCMGCSLMMIVGSVLAFVYVI